jgi:hypothetical protein
VGGTALTLAEKSLFVPLNDPCRVTLPPAEAAAGCLLVPVVDDSDPTSGAAAPSTFRLSTAAESAANGHDDPPAGAAPAPPPVGRCFPLPPALPLTMASRDGSLPLGLLPLACGSLASLASLSLDLPKLEDGFAFCGVGAAAAGLASPCPGLGWPEELAGALACFLPGTLSTSGVSCDAEPARRVSCAVERNQKHCSRQPFVGRSPRGASVASGEPLDAPGPGSGYTSAPKPKQTTNPP